LDTPLLVIASALLVEYIVQPTVSGHAGIAAVHDAKDEVHVIQGQIWQLMNDLGGVRLT